MMTRQCAHSTYVRKEVELPDGFAYHYYQCPECGIVEYPLKQAQKLLDYSKSHIFMFVEDWILAWMAVKVGGEFVPVSGITAMQKQMFILTYEFAPKHDIPSENPGFKAYKYGPFAHRIDRALQTLDSAGLVTSVGRMNTNSERFYLTESGQERGVAMLSRFDKDVLKDLEALKVDLQQFTLDGLLTYVYSKYPEFTDESEIFERVLHRKRS